MHAGLRQRTVTLLVMAEQINTHWGSGLLEGLLSKAGDVVDDRGEVGGTVEFDLGQTHPVGLHHTFDACTHRHTRTVGVRFVYVHQMISSSKFTHGAMICKHTCTERVWWVEIDRKLMGNLLKHKTIRCHFLCQTTMTFPSDLNCILSFACVCSVTCKCKSYLPCGRDLGSKAKGGKHLVTAQEG